jgi:hypothetical protein
MRILAVLLSLALVGCGGGGGEEAPKPAPAAVPFGWWGLGLAHNNGLADNPPGSLALIQGQTPQQIAALAAQARALGKRPVVMLWALLWQGRPDLRADWREALQDTREAVGDAIWYVDDEPAMNGHSLADVQAVAATLPKPVFMSLSTAELDRPVPAAADVVGVNLYVVHGDTPQTAPVLLNKLAATGKRIYLNFDGMSRRDSSGCITTPEGQRASIALNDAIEAWGKGRQIEARFVFRWQADGDICGAKDLPILLPYVLALATKT